MVRDVNRNPRRWMDRSTRVSVIEGWHPSQPDGLGYNLMVDGDWIGTFESLDTAAVAASGHVRSGSTGTKDRPVVLLPYLQPGDE
jgi:hypothetical protein